MQYAHTLGIIARSLRKRTFSGIRGKMNIISTFHDFTLNATEIKLILHELALFLISSVLLDQSKNLMHLGARLLSVLCTN